MTHIVYLGRNDTDHTATFSIDGKRWEYWLTPALIYTLEVILRNGSVGKAFAYAKRRASKATLVENRA